MLRKSILVFVVSICLAAAGSSAESKKSKDVDPDARLAAEIGWIESSIKLPSGAKAIQTYKRYYAWRNKDRLVVEGLFVHPDYVGGNQGVYLVGADEFPFPRDGGCEVISFQANIRQRNIIGVKCNSDGG